jgi:hypothetical protein
LNDAISNGSRVSRESGAIQGKTVTYRFKSIAPGRFEVAVYVRLRRAAGVVELKRLDPDIVEPSWKRPGSREAAEAS